jgi:thiamine-monophosphate kinase
MGAEPAWVTLAMTLPVPDADWLDGFCRGFFNLADRFAVQLVGGDTTQGPLSITVQAHGFVPQGKALQRHGAQPGDHIYVTGSLGDAGLALLSGSDAAEALQQRLDFPEPRLAAGQALRGIASAAIDISDGLLADLGHLLAHGRLGASVSVDDVPTSAAFNAAWQQGDDLTRLRDLTLAAGDDYELCFTVPEALLAQLDTVQPAFSCPCTRIGTVEKQTGIRCHMANGEVYVPDVHGYEHFGVSPHG